MRLLVTHRSRYRYPTPAALGPHVVRLRPATHAKAKIETYALTVEQPCALRWQQDPAGNHLARLSFRAGERIPALDVTVEMAVDVRPVNPFDFFVDPRCELAPFEYPDALARDLVPYLDRNDTVMIGAERLAAFLADLPTEGPTVDLVVALNQAVNRRVRYVIREELGIYSPEETLTRGEASCRDSALLLVAALRSRGLAARFVSGYLIQLTDEGMIPDEPRGVSRDVVDLHAWAEVYLPGAGWVGLDATSGLLCGEGHIPLACTARPAAAAPIEGTSDVVASEVTFEMRVARLGHEPRPTTPYTEEVWTSLLAAGDHVDEALVHAGLELTLGGEPTFTSRLHPEKPEWNGAAMGETKLAQALTLASALKKRLAPGGVVLHGFGKHYPGESLPRFALDVIARRDGTSLAGDEAPVGGATPPLSATEALVRAVATRLGLDASLAQPAFEDPWHFLGEEARLPVGVDPHQSDLGSPEERRRLALVLDRGLKTPVGWVLPLAPLTVGGWAGAKWSFRRERLYLIPGDSPIGLRLPLGSIEGLGPLDPVEEPWDGPPDPRRTDDDQTKQAPLPGSVRPALPPGIRTALCVEPRAGALGVFLPPLPSAARFCELVRAIGEAARSIDVRVRFEGYSPPKSAELFHFAITPDPGVVEVNIPPTRTCRDHSVLMDAVFEAALASGLSAEKYQLDGRQAGSGGGHHITLGGPTPLASPFLRRPDILASLLTFIQHHPSLSYLFNGLFVGPTSQSPRVDEARHDALYELEIAMARAFEPTEAPPPWLADALFRHLLVDLTGNTHRAEVCIDKLFDPQTAHGRQGLVELRAFEMPPHARMTLAQVALVRALVASFAREPYRRPLARWGSLLHDRFLLPTWLWRDFEDVLAHLERAGLALPRDAYRVFLELRCPVIGTLSIGEVTLELRNAIEPWNVLGEELTATGTARFVDSSMERVELRATGLVPERHRIIVNGLDLPMRPTGEAGDLVGGVRFRAWAPAHSLHPHLGVHHPLRFELLDTWGRRSLGACAYHVWHPEGRAFDVPPLTRFEASARRAQRFTIEGPSLRPVRATASAPHPEAPYTVDLRRYALDHPTPEPFEEQTT
ncbi:MAG: transglutaminase family protein [Myxococcales bacterium]|nr:transglutaminase family protein [Myxococcales bacterium]